MVRAIVVLLLVAACAGCAAPQPGSRAADRLVLRNVEIHKDTVWSGRVLIDGWVKVFKGANLTILPGTDIAFTPRDDDRDALGDGTLIVEGSLVAVGHRDAPIVFHSAAPEPQPGDWLELRVDFSRDVHLQYCEIRDSAHALHAHFTRAIVEDCIIRNNIDGSRLGQGSFVIRNSLIEENSGKGINFRNSTVEITHNIIRRNGSGIFLFETDRPPTIYANNLYANGINLRLGDFFQRDVRLGENWWGSADPTAVAATIYDRKADETLGTVEVGIAPLWLEGSGPRSQAQLRLRARLETDGYVDATPVDLGGELLVAGWDGQVRLLDGNGRQLWAQSTGEVIDATPTGDGERVYLQTWGREIIALHREDGARVWSHTYAASPADDHRQAGLILSEGLLLVAAWNGTLQALAPATGKELWRFAAGAFVRATPTFFRDRIYLAAGDGTLHCLNRSGERLWSYRMPAPLLAAPAAADEGVVLLDRAGNLTSLDTDGRVRWNAALAETCYYAAPQHAGAEIFVATAAGSVWKIDAATGAILWRKTGLGPIYATPLVFAGLLAVGDNDGVLHLFGKEDGELLDRFRAGGAIQGGPTSFGQTLVVASRDRNVYLLEVDTRPPVGGATP